MGSVGRSELILLTGGTGHVGYRTLVDALEVGYRVRAAVRNPEGIAKIKAAKSTQPYLSQLEFIIVPDIEKEDAYVEAVKGVDAIIHLASPITRQKTVPTPDQYEAVFIRPAVQGTLNMLRAAKTYSPTTRRIVITTSIAAMLPASAMVSPDGQVFNEQSRVTLDKGPYTSVFQAYSASKVAALLATEEFVRTEKLHFDVNMVSPGLVVGKNELFTTPDEAASGMANGGVLDPILGRNRPGTPSVRVHVKDTAKVHILALNPNIEGGQLFLAVSDDSDTPWDDALEFAKKHFPKAVKDGIFPLSGTNPSLRLTFDTSYTRKMLGIEFLSYEEQVKSAAGHYLELMANEL